MKCGIFEQKARERSDDGVPSTEIRRGLERAGQERGESERYASAHTPGVQRKRPWRAFHWRTSQKMEPGRKLECRSERPAGEYVGGQED